MAESTWEFIGYDIEANGFKPNVIFCICMTDLLTLESKTYYGDDIPEACFILGEAKMVVGHYIRGYDCPVIEKLTDGMITFTEEAKVDTLDMSKRLYPSRQKHSLEMWGEEFGMPKLKSPLFEKFDPAMLPYCRRDVEITVKLFFHLVEKYLEADGKTTFRNHEALNEFFARL
jgi:DNA polymerase III epsilon subunit-like protein